MKKENFKKLNRLMFATTVIALVLSVINPTSAGDLADVDVDVHIQTLIVKTDWDPSILPDEADPYVVIEVTYRGPKGYPKTRTLQTPVQSGVTEGTHATELECTHLIFKNLEINQDMALLKVNAEVWDDDWFPNPDDKMGEGSVNVDNSEGNTGTITVNNADVQMIIGITVRKGCTTVIPPGAIIPEFATIALPVMTILGLVFLFSRRKRKE